MTKLQSFKKFFSTVWQKSISTPNKESVNKVSLIFLILVDIFVLVNVFIGLTAAYDSVPRTSDIYPCYYDFTENENLSKSKERKFSNLIDNYPSSYNKRSNTLGYEIHPICVEQIKLQNSVYYADYRTSLNNQYSDLSNQINENSGLIFTLKDQYDSALLEKIANQESQNSINLKTSDEIKAEIDKLEAENLELEKKQTEIIEEFLSKPEVIEYYEYLFNQKNADTLKQEYKQTQNWYPTQTFIFQLIFLAPLIIVALIWHKFAIKKDYGLQSVLSWHLFLIFLIPVILKIFEFTQFYLIFSLFGGLIAALFGGLLIFVSYFSIILVPFFGYFLIKLLQKYIFNKKVLAKSRVAKGKCINCGKKIPHDQRFCSFCGEDQFRECKNCHKHTYKYLKYCKQCGFEEEV